MRQMDPLPEAKAGLQMSAAALMDGYPKAVKDGRTDAWHKAFMVVADWYDYISTHDIYSHAPTQIEEV